MGTHDYKSYDRSYKRVRNLICPFIVQKFHFSGQHLPEDTGPMFVLCNHNTDVDFLLLVSRSKKPLDFVGTETMLRMGLLSKIAVKLYNPILHDKGSNGAATIKQIVTRIRDGRNILLFPEGNRSFDGRTGEISSAIGKIVKMTGATLVVYRIQGGYFTTPRWGKGIRPGKMTGRVMDVFEPEHIQNMRPQQLYQIIENGLMTDAYEEQKVENIAFKGKRKAEYLETLLFTCPACRKIGKMHSRKDVLACACGYRLTMDDYGYLKDKEGNEYTITDLFAKQKEYLEAKVKASAADSIWADNVRLRKLTSDHSVVADEKATLTVYRNHIAINGTDVKRADITSIDVVQRNRLTIHVKGSEERYEFTGSETFNAVKYRIWNEISFA